MAVDGRKVGCEGSDEIFDYPCTPCAKDGKNVDGHKYCVECDENLCQTCLEHHNKFSVMKGHRITDDKIQISKKKTLEMPSERCIRHGGKVIDEYCPHHDKVGCSTCMNIEHSGCNELKFIPDIVKKVDTLKELRQLQNAVTTTHSRVLDLKQRRQRGLQNLKQDRNTLLKEISSERKKIDDQLNKMETDLLNEVNEVFDEKEKNIDSTIKECDATIVSLEENLQKVKAAESENDSEKYVQMKLGQERKKTDEYHLGRLSKTEKERPMCFQPANQVLKSNFIGQIIKETTIESAVFLDTFDMRIKGDRETCCIHDMYICPDGNIVMADYNNKRIKVVNDSYKVISSINLDDNPACICQVDESSMAVTLINQKKVQFVTQKSPMKLEKSFSVGDRCRGIACKDGLIYVSCGGSKRKGLGEGVGHLEVYNISGTKMASYFESIEYPLYISAPNWSSDLYVSDHRRGVVMFDNYKTFTDLLVSKTPNYDEPQGICWLNRNTLCIAFYNSSTVVQVSRNGAVEKVLLTKKDGIERPYSLCFDKNTSRLFVSFNNRNNVKVFNLKICTI